jgi:hypothetical protein
MSRYTFEVHCGSNILVREPDVELPNRPQVWDRVTQLARGVNEAGSRVVVRDEAGEIIVSIGLWTVRNLVRKSASAAA